MAAEASVVQTFAFLVAVAASQSVAAAPTIGGSMHRPLVLSALPVFARPSTTITHYYRLVTDRDECLDSTGHFTFVKRNKKKSRYMYKNKLFAITSGSHDFRVGRPGE